MIYILTIFSLFSIIFLVLSSEIIHSILWFLLLNINIFFILLYTEFYFLGIVFLFIYVGALTILFLFSIMLLYTRNKKVKHRFHWPSFIIILIIISNNTLNILLLKSYYTSYYYSSLFKFINNLNNIHYLGLYSYFYTSKEILIFIILFLIPFIYSVIISKKLT